MKYEQQNVERKNGREKWKHEDNKHFFFPANLCTVHVFRCSEVLKLIFTSTSHVSLSSGVTEGGKSGAEGWRVNTMAPPHSMGTSRCINTTKRYLSVELTASNVLTSHLTFQWSLITGISQLQYSDRSKWNVVLIRDERYRSMLDIDTYRCLISIYVDAWY